MPWVSTSREPIQSPQAGPQDALSGREPSESLLAESKVPGGHATDAGDVYHKGAANTLNEFGEIVSFVRVVKGELPKAEEKEAVQLRREPTLSAKPHEASFSASVEKEETSAESYHGQVPDRSSTASAPPDFEITSRALFGFMVSLHFNLALVSRVVVLVPTFLALYCFCAVVGRICDRIH